MGSIRVVLFFKILAMVASAETWPVSKPGCPDSCGNISIPYPYGIGDGCFREGFKITCHNNDDGLLRPFSGNIEVIDISLPQGEVRMFKHMAFACYDQAGGVKSNFTAPINLTAGPLRLSNTRNKFTAIGCDTLAYIISETSRNDYMSGCLAVCRSMDSVVNGSCSGIGCCQTSIPKNLDYYKVVFDKDFNHRSVWNFNPCSFAFVADQDWYSFNSSDVNQTEYFYKNKGHVPIVLDWAIRTETTCEEAKLNTSSYACVSDHSQCINSSNGPGYLCNCSTGYEGNPYLRNGCQDIDECSKLEEHSCYGDCKNIPGSYNCTCPPGTYGNPQNKQGCQSRLNSTKYPLLVKLVIGGLGISIAIAIIFWLCIGAEKLKLVRAKRKCFEQNGGFLLRKKISSLNFKIFTREQLEKATHKFHKLQEIGQGGFGSVYKGIFDDQLVAVKKSKIINEQQKKDFANELTILSQLNHKNVVKILGCCLEVEVPMLVYEFVPNGALTKYIHNKNFRMPFTFRLRIAIDSAEALAYLHSDANPPVVHGDVKSSNILLDENGMAKVSDFGASSLTPIDETQMATLVQGTHGYLDPECMQTGHLTQKSDVFSFAVVLLELFTRRKVIESEDSGGKTSLASIFVSSVKDKTFINFLDDEAKNEIKMEQLEDIIVLLTQCLRPKGVERPTMKEVARRLQNLEGPEQHPCVNLHVEAAESSHSRPSNYFTGTSTRFHTIDNQAVFDIEGGR